MDDDDDTKSQRSRKSNNTKSIVGKAARILKSVLGASSVKGDSTLSKRKSLISAKEEKAVPQKLDVVERKLHKDDLPDRHFYDLRQFLHKKHRADALNKKMYGEQQEP